MATLKISELSVGDWVRWKVYDKTYDVQVTGVTDRRIYGLHDGIEYSMLLTQIYPIPITVEILEKNGFARGSRGGFYHYLLLDKNRTLYIHASTNGWRGEITYDAAGILRTTHLMPDMNSVHDIQHALRLAGLDKEINL